MPTVGRRRGGTHATQLCNRAPECIRECGAASTLRGMQSACWISPRGQIPKWLALLTQANCCRFPRVWSVSMSCVEVCERTHTLAHTRTQGDLISTTAVWRRGCEWRSGGGRSLPAHFSRCARVGVWVFVGVLALVDTGLVCAPCHAHMSQPRRRRRRRCYVRWSASLINIITPACLCCICMAHGRVLVCPRAGVIIEETCVCVCVRVCDVWH